jgi:DUF1009 family protein
MTDPQETRTESSHAIDRPSARFRTRLETPPPGSKVGLLAGSGRFPILFAEGARRQGYEVHCVGVRYEAPDELKTICNDFRWRGVTKLGGMMHDFERMGIRNVVMAGKITKSVMHTPLRLLKLMPDMAMFELWYRICRADKRDDTILLGVIEMFERRGLHFASALDYCPELLVKEGILTKRTPTKAQWDDIDFGWTLAKHMGGLDVGQSVAVKERSALAVEAIEGTDRCIERAGQLCPAGGWTLVKVAKPDQDMRFDVPTVGLRTIENLHKARAKVLAVEAERTIFVDQDKVIDLANRYGIIIVSLKRADEPARPNFEGGLKLHA